MPSVLRSDLVLGIETSCDETAAAVVRGPREVLSSVVASQVPIHRRFGGVVPELASRQHLLAIDTVVTDALAQAGVGLSELGGIAVTYGPGLVGSLLVGVSMAKAMAHALGLPLAGVNHHEGHIRALFIENEIPTPAIILLVSGGDTSIYHMQTPDQFRPLCHTRDDAAGEAFDKVARMLGLGYPGGPIIDRLARKGNPRAVPFSRPRMTDGTLDFSFSGLKTAVLRHAQAQGLVSSAGGAGATARPRTPGSTDAAGLASSSGVGLSPPEEDPPREVLDLLASFQETIVSYLVNQTIKATREHSVRALAASGGVACNSRLREMLREAGARLHLPVYFPSPVLTTDNAAMIAAAGWAHLSQGRVADLTLNADPSARL